MTKTIHFITYGNEKFASAKARILKEAEEFNEFETIKGYGPQDLPEDFKKKYSRILSSSRGGGYWVWKVAILKERLKSLSDGEFLIYLDAGCKLNKAGKKRFNEYISMLEESKYGIMSFKMSGNKGPGGFEKEKIWTTREIFDYFNVDINSQIANEGQYLGGILIIKKSSHSNLIIEKYSQALTDNPLLFTDYYNNTNQCSEFKDNRHDQSVLSLIRKKYGSVIIDGDESWMQPFGSGESLKYPFWAIRSRD